MINETIKRLENLIPIENTFIITNKNQANLMQNILINTFLRENIFIEPIAKNTAPCILYSALQIYEKFGDGILCVFPSDHYITDNIKFIETISKAVNAAQKTECVITIGIKPNFPSTGYGYLKISDESKYPDTYFLDRFIEKPNSERAKKYMQSNEYYWNSGIFIWKISVIIDLFKRFLPRLCNAMSQINFGTPLDQIYKTIDSISVDYGIMERLDEAYVIPGDFGWNDLGSWDALGAVFPIDENGNIVKADHIGVNTKECIIYGNKKFIATVGIYNTVIVETDDAFLICAKNKTQDIKYIVEKLNENGRDDLL